MEGDADIARTAALFADPARVRVLLALADGRAVRAGVQRTPGEAAGGGPGGCREVGAAPLLPAGRSGPGRAAEDPGAVLAVTTGDIPARGDARGGAAHGADLLRPPGWPARGGGHGGVARAGALSGASDTRQRPDDRISAPLREHPYTLGPHATAVFGSLGIDLDAAAPGRRHHLAGALGAAVATRFTEAGWARRRGQAHRAVKLTPEGARATRLGLADFAA